MQKGERINTGVEEGMSFRDRVLFLANRAWTPWQMTNPKVATDTNCVQLQRALPKIIEYRLRCGDVVVIDDKAKGLVVGLQASKSKNEIEVLEINRYNHINPEKVQSVLSPSFHILFSPDNGLFIFEIEGRRKDDPSNKYALIIVSDGAYSPLRGFTIATSTNILLMKDKEKWIVDGESISVATPWTGNIFTRIIKIWQRD